MKLSSKRRRVKRMPFPPAYLDSGHGACMSVI